MHHRVVFDREYSMNTIIITDRMYAGAASPPQEVRHE
jgi:hypothetical protein